MSNIIWMSDICNTLTIDGVEYIFAGRDNYLALPSACAVCWMRFEIQLSANLKNVD